MSTLGQCPSVMDYKGKEGLARPSPLGTRSLHQVREHLLLREQQTPGPVFLGGREGEEMGKIQKIFIVVFIVDYEMKKSF